jgi:hypothetical protein
MAKTSSFDWKVVLFAVLGCYVVPWFALTTVSGLLAQPASDGGALFFLGPSLWFGGFSALLYLFGFPFFAGFFTAKYASSRPQLHVVIVALLGFLLAVLVRPGDDPPNILVPATIWLAMAALGAFIVLRSRA